MGTLAEFQRRFGARLRDPKNAPPAGVPGRRMAIYEELLYNNLEGFLLAAYPLTRQLFATRWPRLVRGFFREARCHSPLFRDIPREFLDWLEHDGANRLRLPRWATALAHYECAELAVEILETPLPSHDVQGDLLDGIPVVVPAALNLRYDWPVHHIGSAWRPRKPVETHLLVFRDAEDVVGFAELNAVSARLIALVRDGCTGRAACLQIASEIGHPNSEALVAHGKAMLTQLRQIGAILGTRP